MLHLGFELSILNHFLTDVTPSMHKVRRKSMSAVITSLISGECLSVISLGRNIESKTSEKHQIKRSMRLCSNLHLHSEIGSIYSLMAERLIGNLSSPVILVDWSDLDPRKQSFLLRASVAIEGRSLTLLEEIYPLSQKEKPTVHKQFMLKLKANLPIHCKPIIVSDAGFHVPWFKLVESLGWDYVGRVRNRTFCRNDTDESWHPIKDLYAFSSRTEKSLGAYQLFRNASIACYFAVYQGTRKRTTPLTSRR